MWQVLSYVNDLNAFKYPLLHSIHSSLDSPQPNTDPHQHRMRGKHGKQRQGGGGGGCVPTSQGTLLLGIMHITEVGAGLGNAVRSNATVSDDHISDFPGGGAPRRVKCSVAAWMSLHRELGVNGEARGGWGRGHREVLDPEQDYAPTTLLLPVSHSLSAVEGRWPIQTFLQITNQSMIRIHATTDFTVLQVMHRENKQSF